MSKTFERPEALQDYHVPYALFNELNVWGINRGDIYLTYLELYRGITFRPRGAIQTSFPVFSIPVEFGVMHQWLYHALSNPEKYEKFNNDPGLDSASQICFQ